MFSDAGAVRFRGPISSEQPPTLKLQVRSPAASQHASIIEAKAAGASRQQLITKTDGSS